MFEACGRSAASQDAAAQWLAERVTGALRCKTSARAPTGGLASLVAEGTMVIEQIEPDLTLDGLRLLAERNPVPTLRADRTRLIEQD